MKQQSKPSLAEEYWEKVAAYPATKWSMMTIAILAVIWAQIGFVPAAADTTFVFALAAFLSTFLHPENWKGWKLVLAYVGLVACCYLFTRFCWPLVLLNMAEYRIRLSWPILFEIVTLWIVAASAAFLGGLLHNQRPHVIEQKGKATSKAQRRSHHEPH